MLAVSSVFKRSFKTNDGRVIFKLHETALIMSAIGAVHRFFFYTRFADDTAV